MIERKEYLNKLIASLKINKIKIITGMRRCGKSYLLFNIFKNYLLQQDVKLEQIIEIELDKKSFENLRNPDELVKYLDNKIIKNKEMYIFIDEIQYINGVRNKPGILYSLLRNYSDNDLLHVFITGSNSKFLSKDIETEFRGRGHIIQVHPLSYKEYYNYLPANKRNNSLKDYATYGGMPGLFEYENINDRIIQLKDYFSNVYINDIVERYKIENITYLNLIIEELASSIGSLSSPTSIYKSLLSSGYKEISQDTVSNYFIYLEESFLFSKCVEYNIKGKEYFNTKYKFYMEDIGLRNSLLNFRQLEPTHIYENIVYLELVRRGYLVDIGVVRIFSKDNNSKTVIKDYEVDFIIQNGMIKKYIQYVYHIENIEKYLKEIKSFKNIDDGFEKIIITNDEVLTPYTEDGYRVINIEDFLLNDIL